ncbi:hypothetical protein QW060_04210 [Myroides ceti]|uniref:Uncharacterized protein n=1 Tax=Paenimyroides ceti TaxID=395087 RepID=A0ABT8CRC4_9FLAO|nr:hypothetical protein [Paenimyroides ceti]MDN3706326.1 hypothetical protein [Paenimyroides ceti]
MILFLVNCKIVLHFYSHNYKDHDASDQLLNNEKRKCFFKVKE